MRANSISAIAVTASAWLSSWSRRASQVLRSIIARTTARSARGDRLDGRFDESGDRSLDFLARLGDVRVDIGLVADRAQLRRTALVDREHLSHETLDALHRGVEAVEEGGHASGIGQRDDLPRDLAAGGNELIERGEVAVDGAHAYTRARRDVVPARRGDALLAVELKGRVDDPLPCLRGGGGPAAHVVFSRRHFLDEFSPRNYSRRRRSPQIPAPAPQGGTDGNPDRPHRP